jgi:hypothetical protein
LVSVVFTGIGCGGGDTAVMVLEHPESSATARVRTGSDLRAVEVEPQRAVCVL